MLRREADGGGSGRRPPRPPAAVPPRCPGAGRPPRRAAPAFALAAALLLPLPRPADAASHVVGGGCDLAEGEGGVVAAVTDGGALILDSGLEVRLAGTIAPLPPPGNPDGTPWPAAGAAKAALERLALGEAVALRYGGARRDRYGRALAQVFLLPEAGDAVWLQERMLSAGLARAFPAPGETACMEDLVGAERRARDSGLGIWRDPYYAIRAATDPALASRRDTYDLVEGRIVSVGERGPVVYLDFGRVWATDFTAVLAGAAGARLRSAGIEPRRLEGRRVRLRGWIGNHDGPSLRITEPEQIELLDVEDR